MSELLVDAHEIAERLGVTVDGVRNWVKREYLKFPESRKKGRAPNSSREWWWSEVVAWCLKNRPHLL